QLDGDLVEVDLEREPGLRGPVPALRPARRLVGEDTAALELVARDLVRHRLERARVEGRGHPVGAIRAAVQVRAEMDREDLTVPPDTGPDPHEDGVATAVGVD